MNIIVRQFVLFIFLIFFSSQLVANSVVGKSLFCKDSKNQYRGIHFLDEKFVVSYRFFDQSICRKISMNYQVQTIDLIQKIYQAHIDFYIEKI